MNYKWFAVLSVWHVTSRALPAARFFTSSSSSSSDRMEFSSHRPGARIEPMTFFAGIESPPYRDMSSTYRLRLLAVPSSSVCAVCVCAYFESPDHLRTHRQKCYLPTPGDALGCKLMRFRRSTGREELCLPCSLSLEQLPDIIVRNLPCGAKR